MSTDIPSDAPDQETGSGQPDAYGVRVVYVDPSDGRETVSLLPWLTKDDQLAAVVAYQLPRVTPGKAYKAYNLDITISATNRIVRAEVVALVVLPF